MLKDSRHLYLEAPSPATRILSLGPFVMHRGGILPEMRIAYETWGELNGERDNAVLLFTGLSPSAHAASSPQDPTPGWWEYMVGARKPIDTERFFVLCINSPGSCFGSTGPASLNPETERPYGLDFPELSIEDIAHAGRETVRALGVERLAAVVGASLGGVVALSFAMQFPRAARHLATLSSAAHARPFAIAVRSLQREIIRSDPKWQEGRYPPGGGPLEGMRLARKLGLISYRSALEWQHRFGRKRVPGERRVSDSEQTPFGIEFEIESYLEANARRFTGDFDANCYLYLSRALDHFDAAEHGGSLQGALSLVEAERTLVVGVETDFLFPLEQQQEIADLLLRAGRAVRFVALPSLQGHDSFLVDEENFAPVVASFFREIRTGEAPGQI